MGAPFVCPRDFTYDAHFISRGAGFRVCAKSLSQISQISQITRIYTKVTVQICEISMICVLYLLLGKCFTWLGHAPSEDSATSHPALLQRT